jgi:hypothetical protein
MFHSAKISSRPANNRHPQKGGDPAFFITISTAESWAPVCVGVTFFEAGDITP